MRTLTVWQMLETISGMCDTKDISDWENKFIKSCVQTCGPNKITNFLSGKQVEKIESIYEKHFCA